MLLLQCVPTVNCKNGSVMQGENIFPSISYYALKWHIKTRTINYVPCILLDHSATWIFIRVKWKQMNVYSCGYSCVFPVSTIARTKLSKYNKSEMQGRSSTCWYSNLNTWSVKHYSAEFLHLYYLYLFSLLCKTYQQKSEKLFSSMKVYIQTCIYRAVFIMLQHVL